MLKPHKPGLRAIISCRSCSLIQHAAAFTVQTVAEPWHSRAVTRPGMVHLPANFFNARLLTRSTLLRRQCHVVVFLVTGALDSTLGAGSWFAVTRRVTREEI